MYKILLALLFPLTISAQSNWEGIGNSFFGGVGGFAQVYEDTVENVLYVPFHGFFPQEGYYIGVWDGDDWDYIGPMNGEPYAVIRYNDDILVGGNFSVIENDTVSYLAKWNGQNWESFGFDTDGPVWKFKIYEDNLFVVGGFYTLGGQTCNQIAMWDGSNWSNEYSFIDSQGVVFEVGMFKNELYAGGTISVPEKGIRGVAVYRNGEWISPGNGFAGSLVYVDNLIEYKGRLYATGQFSEANGNVGNSFQVWDGSIWQKVGSGITGVVNARVFSVQKLNDKLYIGGNFIFAGNIPAFGLVSWDGEKFCKVKGDFVNPVVLRVGTYSENLVIFTNSPIIDNDTVDHIAIWKGGDYIDTCGQKIHLIPVFTETIDNFNSVNIFPNPTQSHISISLPENLPEIGISIYDATGREVYRRESFTNDSKIQLDVSGFIPGLYFVKLKSKEKRYQGRFVVLE
ncbi:MAG: T9SS C-terminal target domain-containing protein [Chitinophagaceae bacterium]|nr:MAG: T9SS C-terminal target domain-containing protein [Chitinophagaceae bacterium]